MCESAFSVTNSADVGSKGCTSVFSDESASLPDHSEIVRALLDPIVNASCLGLAYLAKIDPSSPWFPQEAVAFWD